MNLPTRRAFLRSAFLAAALPPLASLALAHPGHPGDGLAAGLLHPLTGVDHLTAMVALGIWAMSFAGSARAFVPAAFLALMAIGAAWGHVIGPIPGTEQAVAASVFVLGILLAGAVRLPAAAGTLLAGLFALFHGLAHGAEISGSIAGVGFTLGMLATSAALIAAGMGWAAVASRRSPLVPRLAGGLIAVFAILLFTRI